MTVKHSFHSNVADTGIPDGLVKPSHFNADHVLEGLLAVLDAIAVQPDTVPYVDAGGSGGQFAISSYMRGLMSSASSVALLTGLGAAPLASPAFTGTPTAPTAATSTNTTQIATTAFVQAVVAQLVGGSPALLDTLNELATALGNDPNFAITMTNALALKAPINSPTFTGTPAAPTVAGSADSTTKIATTAFVQAVRALLAPLASPALTGTPTAPTAAGGTNTTQIATTAFVVAALNSAQAIANGTDFDTLTTEGTYYNTGTCPNTPVGAGIFFLSVSKGNGTTNTMQMAVELSTANTYVRTRNAGVWTAWNAVSFAPSQIPATTSTTQPGTDKVNNLISATLATNFDASATPKGVASIALTPGVWDIEAHGAFGGGGAVNSSEWALAISTTNNSISGGGLVAASSRRRPSAADINEDISIQRRRVTVTTNTAYYVSAQATYSGGTYGVTADIWARRV